MAKLEPLMERNFLEYASYVIVDRAIPDLRDGLKPVQRRILYTLVEQDDGKFHKVANVIGETMKLHPHGDASIGDALVVMANKDFFIEKQGNFGNVMTGHSAAAPRYIECRLTELARETLFNKALTEFQPSYDGRKKEPVYLPVKLPVPLILGTEGIAVGMSTKIMPHNLPEVLQAQIDVLRHKSIEVYPDFATGGIIDISEYNDGRGKVKVRAKLEQVDDKTIVIREIPYSTTTEGLIASIEAAAQKGKVKISSINDFTTDHVEIEIGLPRGHYTDDVIPQLYAYTDCEVSISSNIVVIKDRHPVEMSVSETVRFLTDRLRDQICAELELELEQLRNKKHWLTLERIFVEGRLYKRIENAKSEEQVKAKVYRALKPFEEHLTKPVDDDDIKRLLDIPIRRISQYDIDKNRRTIEDIEIEIKKVEARLSSLTKTTIKYLKDLIKKFGKQYPRRSQIQHFEAVDVKAVARQDIKLSYDSETGFFGSEVKGDEYQLTVSEYDRILYICKNGTYRIIGPEDKILIEDKVLYLDVFDQEEGIRFTVVYRDKQRTAYAKKIHIKRFIRDREYELIKDKKGKIDYLLPGDAENELHLHFVRAKRQRVTEAFFDLAELGEIGPAARGTRLAAKPIARIKLIKTADTPKKKPPTGGSSGGSKKDPKPTKPTPPKKKAPTSKKSPKTKGKGKQITLF